MGRYVRMPIKNKVLRKNAGSLLICFNCNPFLFVRAKPIMELFSQHAHLNRPFCPLGTIE